MLMILIIIIFFFQAEDGIRDLTVTGVQTCALPIFTANSKSPGTWIFWATVAARPSSRWPSASFDSSLDSFGSWAHEPHTHHSPFPIPLSPSRKGVKKRLRNIERRCPRKKRRRQRPPTLPLKFRDAVRPRHRDRDARRQRQPDLRGRVQPRPGISRQAGLDAAAGRR